MSQVVFVGLGLGSEKGITVEGLEEAQQADQVYAEFYTNLMPNLSLSHLEEKIGKKIVVLTRTQLEDENAKEILKSAENGKVVFLVPGDPMIATTHVTLRLALTKRGIPSRIVHGASIVSAICGATGLQSFKFGKSITLPHSEGHAPASVLETIRENKTRGLHTLLLLELKPDTADQLTIQTALPRLARADSSVDDWLAVGAARISSSDEKVKAAKVRILRDYDFGACPHCIVFPGKLHFMEEEALRVLDGASPSDLEIAP